MWDRKRVSTDRPTAEREHSVHSVTKDGRGKRCISFYAAYIMGILDEPIFSHLAFLVLWYNKIGYKNSRQAYSLKIKYTHTQTAKIELSHHFSRGEWFYAREK